MVRTARRDQLVARRHIVRGRAQGVVKPRARSKPRICRQRDRRCRVGDRRRRQLCSSSSPPRARRTRRLSSRPKKPVETASLDPTFLARPQGRTMQHGIKVNALDLPSRNRRQAGLRSRPTGSRSQRADIDALSRRIRAGRAPHHSAPPSPRCAAERRRRRYASGKRRRAAIRRCRGGRPTATETRRDRAGRGGMPRRAAKRRTAEGRDATTDDPMSLVTRARPAQVRNGANMRSRPKSGSSVVMVVPQSRNRAAGRLQGLVRDRLQGPPRLRLQGFRRRLAQRIGRRARRKASSHRQAEELVKTADKAGTDGRSERRCRASKRRSDQAAFDPVAMTSTLPSATSARPAIAYGVHA